MTTAVIMLHGCLDCHGCLDFRSDCDFYKKIETLYYRYGKSPKKSCLVIRMKLPIQWVFEPDFSPSHFDGMV